MKPWWPRRGWMKAFAVELRAALIVPWRQIAPMTVQCGAQAVWFLSLRCKSHTMERGREGGRKRRGKKEVCVGTTDTSVIFAGTPKIICFDAICLRLLSNTRRCLRFKAPDENVIPFLIQTISPCDQTREIHLSCLKSD